MPGAETKGRPWARPHPKGKAAETVCPARVRRLRANARARLEERGQGRGAPTPEPRSRAAKGPGHRAAGLRKPCWRGRRAGGRGLGPSGRRKRLGSRRPAPGSRVQGSAVFRLPSDLTLGAQRPPGCAAMAQPSSRCQINEPTSGWVYSSAGTQPSGK